MNELYFTRVERENESESVTDILRGYRQKDRQAGRQAGRQTDRLYYTRIKI